MTMHAKKKLARLVALAAVTASAVVSLPSTAHAEPVTPTAKGAVGGGLLGAELVVFGEALFGVHKTWAYLVGAGVGAAGGAVGGYLIEQAVDDGRVPAYLLAGGLAALIPAVVIGLDATRYLPSEGAREDKPVPSAPSDPGKPGGSSVVGAEAATPTSPSTTPPTSTPSPTPPPAGGGTAPTPAPQSLLDVHDGAFRMGVPVPQVRSILGSAERTRMGVDNRGSELRFPVVRVVF